MNFAIVVLGIHDNDKVCWNTNTPAEWARGHNHLYSPCNQRTKNITFILENDNWTAWAAVDHSVWDWAGNPRFSGLAGEELGNFQSTALEQDKNTKNKMLRAYPPPPH